MKTKAILRKQELKRFLVLFFVFALASTFVPGITNAAALTSLSDTMSRLKISETSNHTIKFTTPTGAADTSDTITVTMPTGFTIGSVVFGDMDLSHGATTGYETELTLGAAAGAGVWGASFTGQVLTLTHPTDATGDIAASDVVVIEIGTNASSGTNQITNHSSAATYTIEIGGTFGDDGKIAVPIITDDQVVIDTTINPYITFVLSQNTVTLTQTGGSEPDYTATGYNEGSANTLAASTNAESGYNISYDGSTLTSGSNTIDAMGTQGASSTGTEQFGINLKDNATPNTGSEPSGGSGVPESNYNTADQFTFIADAVTSLASSATSSVTTTFEATYIVNVSQTTEAGAYSTTITYICTGNF
ncbi:hypothetical protein ACFLZS_00755 [Patescibacteria group bacterium]